MLYMYLFSLAVADPCSSNPCHNGGVCSGGTVSFECDCSRVTGWTGSLCDVNINECISDSQGCLNGGVCQDTPGGYTCDCSAIDYTGDRCETGMIKCDAGADWTGGNR